MSNPNADAEANAIAADSVSAGFAQQIQTYTQQITSYNQQITQMTQQLAQTNVNLTNAQNSLATAQSQYISRLTDILNGFSSAPKATSVAIPKKP